MLVISNCFLFVARGKNLTLEESFLLFIFCGVLYLIVDILYKKHQKKEEEEKQVEELLKREVDKSGSDLYVASRRKAEKLPQPVTSQPTAPPAAPQQKEEKPAPTPNQQLATAIMDGDLVKVKEIATKEGVDINAVSYCMMTPLLSAIVNGHPHIVDWLLEQDDIDPNAGNSLNSPLLACACQPGYEPQVRRLIEMGANVNFVSREHLITPLIAAAIKGHSEYLLMLLQAGADPMHEDKYGWTAYDKAVENEHDACARILKTHMTLIQHLAQSEY